MNYAELVTAIEDTCQTTETSFVAHIPDFVRTAEQRIYNAVQLPNLRKHSTGAMTLGNRYLSAPTDFLSAFAMAVRAPTTDLYTEMQYRDVDWLREAYPDPAATGIPAYYALWDDNTFLLSKTPDVAYNVELHYYYKPTSIVSASTTWLGTNFDSVLLYGALVQAYIYQKGEADMVTLYENQFKEGLALLKTVADGKSRERKL